MLVKRAEDRNENCTKWVIYCHELLLCFLSIR